METNRELITFSKFLATIKIDVPIQLEMDLLVREQADEESLRQIFEELEFRTLIDRVLKKENSGNGTGTANQTATEKKTSLLSRFFPGKVKPYKAIYLQILRTMGRAKAKIQI